MQSIGAIWGGWLTWDIIWSHNSPSLFYRHPDLSLHGAVRSPQRTAPGAGSLLRVLAQRGSGCDPDTDSSHHGWVDHEHLLGNGHGHPGESVLVFMSRCFADLCGSHKHRWWITNAAHVCSDFKVACTYSNCSQREQIRNDQKLELHTCVCLYMQACPCVLECICWMFSLEFLWISSLKRVSNSFSLLLPPFPCAPHSFWW